MLQGDADPAAVALAHPCVSPDNWGQTHSLSCLCRVCPALGSCTSESHFSFWSHTKNEELPCTYCSLGHQRAASLVQSCSEPLGWPGWLSPTEIFRFFLRLLPSTQGFKGLSPQISLFPLFANNHTAAVFLLLSTLPPGTAGIIASCSQAKGLSTLTLNVPCSPKQPLKHTRGGIASLELAACDGVFSSVESLHVPRAI